MTIFLICMIPVSGLLGFVMCALCVAAGDADRQDERLFAEYEQQQKQKEETA